MSAKRTLAWTAGALFGAAVAFGDGVTAQSQSTVSQPTHKHYVHSPEQNQPGPNGELAPRLQNLRRHAFTVSTKHRQAQLFMNQGLNLS